MEEIRFEKGVLGTIYWKYSDVWPDGRSYKEWYGDTYERGIWTIHNAYELSRARPFYLRQHDSYDIYRGVDMSNMDRWEKYIKPGWNINEIAKVDGNAIISKEVAIKVLPVGFGAPIGHSDYELYFKKTAGTKAFEQIKKLVIGPTVKKEKEEGKLSYNGIWSGLEGKESIGIAFDPLYQAKSVVRSIETDKVLHAYVGKSGICREKEEHCRSRGVVPGDFVKTYVDSDCKVYKMESFTQIKKEGDLMPWARIYVNPERPLIRGVPGIHGFPLGDPMLHSYKHIGHDVVIGMPRDDRYGVFEIDEWLRILKPLVMLHWAGEFGMALAAGFVVYVSVNGYYYVLFKLCRYVQWEGEWDPDVYYWCYWDHRDWNVKSLEWAFRGHLREAVLLESSHYYEKYEMAREYSLSTGYGLEGALLRVYEWLESFSGGVMW